MSDLNNPMRFSTSRRSINIEELLNHPDFSEKRVTTIDVRPSEGNIYVHWKERGEVDD